MKVLANPEAFFKAIPLWFVLIWSTGFIAARYGMPHAPPMSFLLWRYLLSLACFLFWISLTRVAWPRDGMQWLHLGLTGVLMQACYLSGVWMAVKAGMGSGLTSLIVGLQPVLTAIWLSASGARVLRRQWIGLILGFAGLLLVLSDKFIQGLEVTSFTLCMAVLALFGITAGTLYQKRFVKYCDVRTASVVQMSAALIVTFPLALLESEPMVWNAELVGAMAWSVLVLTLGGGSLFYLLIQRGAATDVASLMYLVPPTTALLAWLLFAEPVTLTIVLGTALAALGVSLVLRPTQPGTAAA